MAEQYATYRTLNRTPCRFDVVTVDVLGGAAENHGLQGRVPARMVTTEIRRDPITGRSVVIDLAPFKRRDDFELEPVRLEDPPAACPFCEGREADAGPEILAWREGGPANVPGWSVRVVPNRHPMLRIEGGMDVRSHGAVRHRATALARTR